MFTTTNCTVYSPTRGERDAFGNSARGFDAGTDVSGVLVAPGSTDDLDASRPDGVTVSLTLHFPKTFEGDLRGCEIKLPEPWAGRYRVVGEPMPYMSENTPGAFWLPVEVVRANG